MTVSLIYYANQIFERTKTLSIAVNKDLLLPLSKWLDDPDFMKRHAVTIDKEVPNWAEYKRSQRYYNTLAMQEAARQKRLTKKQLKELRAYHNSLIPRGSPRGRPQLKPSCDFLTSIISPFSPVEQKRQETLMIFESANSLSMTDRLPWKALIASELTGESKTLNDLTIYIDKGADRIAKLQILLQMDMEGSVIISQNEQFGNITISPVEVDDTNIKIKDQQGNTHAFDWQDLSENQRNKILADLRINKIVKVS